MPADSTPPSRVTAAEITPAAEGKAPSPVQEAGLSPGASTAEGPPAAAAAPSVPGTLWLVTSDVLGRDETIGSRLVQSFFNSLADSLTEPAGFAFLNRGVLLALDDSPVLEALRQLEAGGCRLLSCGTCLDFYDARARLGVGEVGGMVLIQELMLSCSKVISL